MRSSASELPEHLIRFIQHSVPSIDAVDVLLLLVRRRWSTCTQQEIASAVGGAADDAAISSYLELLRTQGVITSPAPGVFRYDMPAPDIALAVDTLVNAYDERPVTLIRTVYRIADSRGIQTFADAFKLRKDQP